MKIKETVKTRELELPEAPFISNGDEVKNEDLKNLFDEVLGDRLKLVAVTDTDFSLSGEIDYLLILRNEEGPTAKALFNRALVTQDYGTLLFFRGTGDLPDVLFNRMEDMGRYPKSESGGDDDFVSLSYTYSKEKIEGNTYHVVDYWYDDSTR